jgi:hypothetical protein
MNMFAYADLQEVKRAEAARRRAARVQKARAALVKIEAVDPEKYEPLKTDGWEEIEVPADATEFLPPRPLLYYRTEKGALEPRILDADGHVAATRAEHQSKHAYGPTQRWAVVLTIGVETYRWIYKGPLSLLRRFVVEEEARQHLYEAGALGLGDRGTPTRIERLPKKAVR